MAHRLQNPCKKEDEMLWTLIVLLVLFWAIGLALDVAGGLIHLLLVVALVVVVFRLLTGRRVA
jgi:hypothetical protein